MELRDEGGLVDSAQVQTDKWAGVARMNIRFKDHEIPIGLGAVFTVRLLLGVVKVFTIPHAAASRDRLKRLAHVWRFVNF
jgi:hypothetical protein